MAQPQFLDALVRHAGSSAMVDIVVRLVGCAETDSGTAALEVRTAGRAALHLVPVPRRAQPTFQCWRSLGQWQWVLRENLVEKLAALYDADQHPDVRGPLYLRRRLLRLL